MTTLKTDIIINEREVDQMEARLRNLIDNFYREDGIPGLVSRHNELAAMLHGIEKLAKENEAMAEVVNGLPINVHIAGFCMISRLINSRIREALSEGAE